MIMKKIILTIILIFGAINTYAADLEKLIVVLDWFPNPDHAPLIVAQQQGFFKEQQLDVELIGPADPTDPPQIDRCWQSRHWYYLST